MPSIQDVADQINAKLDQINQNTADSVAIGNGIRNDLAQVNAKLDTLDNDLHTLDNHFQVGLANISSGLFAIWETQKVTNSILEYQSAQNNTLICLVENTNELLCGITRKFTQQLGFSQQLVKSLQRVEGITERVQTAAAADFDRLAELHKQLLDCCPPEVAQPEPCPEACSIPDEKPYRPKGQDWKPAQQPDQTRVRSRR